MYQYRRNFIKTVSTIIYAYLLGVFYWLSIGVYFTISAANIHAQVSSR